MKKFILIALILLGGFLFLIFVIMPYLYEWSGAR